MIDLPKLAGLIRMRNQIEVEISALTGRPAQIGHIGEHIAAQVFDIKLHSSASHYGSDGIFASGPLAGQTVDVKWYAMNESVLDLHSVVACDYYLVLAGPKPAGSARGGPRPWLICNVYLFRTPELLAALQARGVRIGLATSLTKACWDAAEIYPNPRNSLLRVSAAQRGLLALFE